MASPFVSRPSGGHLEAGFSGENFREKNAYRAERLEISQKKGSKKYVFEQVGPILKVPCFSTFSIFGLRGWI